MNDLIDAMFRFRIFGGSINFPGKHIVAEEFEWFNDIKSWKPVGNHMKWTQTAMGEFESTNHSHVTHSFAEINLGKITNISFDWQVSSEDRFDYINVYLNGSRVVRASGYRSGSFSQAFDGTTDVTIRLNYWKDGSVSRGSDRGYIRNLKVR